MVIFYIDPLRVYSKSVGGKDCWFTGRVEPDLAEIQKGDQVLLVDYVRVYDRTNVVESTPVKCGDFCCDPGETRESCPSDCSYVTAPAG
jgi:hypothetical protein